MNSLIESTGRVVVERDCGTKTLYSPRRDFIEEIASLCADRRLVPDLS